MPVKANEYYGRMQFKTREEIAADFAPYECGGLGHLWPDEGFGPCERCGKASAIPSTDCCRHGVPDGGRFGGHDCAYSDARDALIPFAEAAADHYVEGLAYEDVDARWTVKFHETMDLLADHLRRHP